MKYIILGLTTLLMLGGCVGQQVPPPPKPKPVVKQQVEPKPVYKAPLRKGEVPPLPEREVDVDLDNVVDDATAEVLNNDNAVQ